MATRRFGSDTLGGEYPDRYGIWDDEAENKLFINKNEKVRTIEQRNADGSIEIHDFRNSTYEFRDKAGTYVHIDRGNQEAVFEFGDCVFEIKNGTLRIEAEDIEIQSRRHLMLKGTKSLVLASRAMSWLGRTLNNLIRRNSEPY